MGCEFKMRTTKPEGPGALIIIQMSHPEIHTCSAGKLAPLQQCIDAKVSYAKRMKEDLDVRWSKIWNGERILEHTGCLKKNFLLPNLAFANIAVDGEKSNNSYIMQKNWV